MPYSQIYRLFRYLSIITGVFYLSCQSKPPIPPPWEGQNFELLIRNVLVVDGSGKSGYVADVLVRDDTIAFIGTVDSTSVIVSDIIEGKEKVLAPGFIDTHAHGDAIRRPDFQNFLMQGVTSISLGQDGSSPPFPNLRYWMDTVDQIGPGVNIVPFVGHGSLRLMSPVRFQRVPDPAALDSLVYLLEDAMRAGAWGLSLGLEYTPGLYAQKAELERLAEALQPFEGVMMSHIRNEDDEGLDTAIQELLDLGRFGPVHVSHLKSVYGRGSRRAQRILARLQAAREKGYQVTADIYPYTASYTTIGILFPDWARPPQSFGRVMRRRRAELDTFLRKRIVRRNGPESTLFGAGPYTGQTLAEVATAKGKRPERVLMEDIGPTGASAAYFVMDSLLQLTLLQDSLTNICSDGSPNMRHPRGYGSFARIIEVLVVQDSVLSLEQAIHKMSGLAAQTLGLPKRGFLRPGYTADMILFDPQDVKAHATYAAPHQLATGVEQVWIAGKTVIQEGTWNGARLGKVLRKAQ